MSRDDGILIAMKRSFMLLRQLISCWINNNPWLALTISTAKDKRNTKEDTGKFVKNALYILRYAKRHSSG